MADIERFSHGEDGFWRDPDGLYVEYKDFEAAQSEASVLREELEEAETVAGQEIGKRQGIEYELEREQAALDALRGGLEKEADLLDDLCCFYINDPGDEAELLAQCSDRLQALLSSTQLLHGEGGGG